jgi:hypothetical protein
MSEDEEGAKGREPHRMARKRTDSTEDYMTGKGAHAG